MNLKLQQIQNWAALAQESGWSVAVLAKKCGVSLRTLERHFLREMGKSPKAWLAEQRKQLAIELLMKSNGPVKQVAGELGYKHATHFSREFKKHWKICPAELGQKHSKSAGGWRVLV